MSCFLPPSDDSSSLLSFQVVAPGRICFFGEHSDYLGLPVIARAIPLFCTLHVSVNEIGASKKDIDDTNPNDDDANSSSTTSVIHPRLSIHLHVPEELGGHSKVYVLQNLPPSPPPEGQPVDFALAAIHEVLKEGWDLTDFITSLKDPNSNSGTTTNSSYAVHCYSTSGELSLQAGCSSSTAFLVAWVLMMARLAGKDDVLRQDPIMLAKMAWRAEVEHFGHPGGTMDHVAIALGTCVGDGDHYGALRIGPGQWQVERLSPFPQKSNMHSHNDGVWILADSGEPKDTLKHLKRCKDDRLQILREKLNGDWDCPESSAKPMSTDEGVLWKATLINRASELEAAKLWRLQPRDADDYNSVGHCLALQMKKHHEALRDGLGLSTPRLEAMNEAAKGAGAWAFKVVGSGGGGCGVAWAPVGKEDAVTKAMKEAGAKATWVIDSQQLVRGARIYEERSKTMHSQSS
ncbi:MAG: hypothetical protein SGILL_008716 [Bacillariaceae sp.]